MNKEESAKLFFQCLGEIWRDITWIEFLMRCAIAKHDGEIKRFPMPPYSKDKIIKNPPESFLHLNFETVREKFNTRYTELQIPMEIINLRHAIAHGLIAEINHSGVDELIKFKQIKGTKDIQIEFHMSLEIPELVKKRQEMYDLRHALIEIAKD